jgi:hypothetical protein
MSDRYKAPDEIERNRGDRERYRRMGIESYEQKLDRWREGWRRELEEDLERGR